MKTIDFSYFIERYNAGEMDEAEMQWFSRELKGNEKLRKEVELRNKTDDILMNQDLMKLRNKLNAIEKNRAVSVPAGKHRPPVIKYAAVVAALIILGSLALLTNRKPNTDELIDRYYKPYETASASRSAELISNNDYNLAVEYYNIRDYRNAAIYFSKVLDKDPGDMPSTLLNGISNFEIQNYSEAKRSFSKVIDNNDNYFIDHAQWYLAMCYLRTDERNKAIQELTIIKNSNTIYRKPAKKLLKSLR